MNTDEVLDQGLRTLARWDVRPAPAPAGRDGQLRLEAGGRGARTYLLVVKEGMPERLARSTPLPEGDVLVVAPYIGAAAGEALRARGADYVDGTGAAHLAWENLLVHTESSGGSDRPRRDDRPGGPGRHRARLRTRVGQQVVLALLTWPTLAAQPLRTVAAAAGVSLGAAHQVVDALEQTGHLDDSRHLVRGADLLTGWIDAYAVGLGARPDLGRYAAPAPDWWREAHDLDGHGVQIGGEAAVSVLDPWLSPRTVTLYADEVPAPVLAAHRLRRDEDGEVHVRRRFWRVPPGEEPQALVPVVLVYGDLMASGDPRQQDAAARLRENDARLVDIDRR